MYPGNIGRPVSHTTKHGLMKSSVRLCPGMNVPEQTGTMTSPSPRDAWGTSALNPALPGTETTRPMPTCPQEPSVDQSPRGRSEINSAAELLKRLHDTQSLDSLSLSYLQSSRKGLDSQKAAIGFFESISAFNQGRLGNSLTPSNTNVQYLQVSPAAIT